MKKTNSKTPTAAPINDQTANPQAAPTPAAVTPKSDAKAKGKKAAAKVEKEEEPVDRLPTSVAELKESKSGLVTFLFLSGKDKEQIAGELKTAFKLGDAQAVKIVRRITGRARFFRRAFDLMAAK